MTRGVVEQIRAAYHFGDTRRCIIHDYGKLIGIKAITPFQDDVAHFFMQLATKLATQCVGKTDSASRASAQAPRYIGTSECGAAHGACPGTDAACTETMMCSCVIQQLIA